MKQKNTQNNNNITNLIELRLQNNKVIEVMGHETITQSSS